MAKLLNQITSKDWSFSILQQGQVAEDLADINQCIVIILKTVKGTDPLRPTFGCDIFKYIDRPVSYALPNIVRETAIAIDTWEKRVVVTKITPVLDVSHMTIRVEWKTLTSEQIKTTTVKYGNPS